MTKLRSRLTYANVISTIALLVAVGGGTALAVSHINAARVDGLNAAKLNFERPLTVGPNPKFTKVFDQGGLVIRARCGDLSGFFMDAKAELQGQQRRNPGGDDRLRKQPRRGDRS